MDDITGPSTPTRPPHRYNTASPITQQPPPPKENTTSPTTPTRPPSRYNTASPITPPQPPRSDVRGSPITPWRPPIPDITASPTIRFRPPIPDITASPTIRFRPPIPDITVSPAIRFRPPISDITASPIIRVRPPIPDITASPTIPFHPPIPPITARPANQPTLNVSPSPPVEVGKPVLFEVVLWQPPPPGWNLQYRFDFGDGTRTDWKSERQATHTYLSPRNGGYPVHVEIASTYRDRVMPTKAIDKNVDVIRPSNPTPSATAQAPITPSPAPITPSPTSSYTPIATAAPTSIPSIAPIPSPSPALRSSKMLWLYIAGGLAVAGLVSFIYTKWKPKTVIAGPLAFYPHSDWDTPQKPPANVSIKYGLYFHPNVSAGQDRLETDGASSILRKKKQ
jgi:PKD domain